MLSVAELVVVDNKVAVAAALHGGLAGELQKLEKARTRQSFGDSGHMDGTNSTGSILSDSNAFLAVDQIECESEAIVLWCLAVAQFPKVCKVSRANGM